MSKNAYCWRTGVVEFGSLVPRGARLIADDLDDDSRGRLETRCRRAYDGKTLLVPGVPEAVSEFDAERAVDRFIKWAVDGKSLTKREIAQSRAALNRSLRSAEKSYRQKGRGEIIA